MFVVFRKKIDIQENRPLGNLLFDIYKKRCVTVNKCGSAINTTIVKCLNL